MLGILGRWAGAGRARSAQAGVRGCAGAGRKRALGRAGGRGALGEHGRRGARACDRWARAEDGRHAAGARQGAGNVAGGAQARGAHGLGAGRAAWARGLVRAVHS